MLGIHKPEDHPLSKDQDIAVGMGNTLKACTARVSNDATGVDRYTSPIVVNKATGAEVIGSLPRRREETLGAEE
jgi:hypothetical protein